MTRLLTVPEAAEALHVGDSTIRRWCRTGDLTAVKYAGGSPWLIPTHAIEKFIRDHTYHPTT